MYVCLCKAVKEEDLISMSRQGMSNSDILRVLSVGKDCGVCISDALERLNLDKEARTQEIDLIKLAKRL